MILLKTKEEIEIMREGGRRLAFILSELKKEVRAGVATIELDKMARVLLRDTETKAAFLNYRPSGAIHAFPAALCTSINDAVVHGTPGEEVLKEGDLVKLDMGLIYKGFYVDSATTVGIGKISKDAERLMRATRESLAEGIKMAKPGNTLGDIGWAVSSRVLRDKFGIVQALTGHGIGKSLHEDPHVFNVGRRDGGEKLVSGMVLAIEPMIALGDGRVRQDRDESFRTVDGSLTAHFEHTVAITERGPLILTKA
ncbi:MAG: type I methionyl aminopeptidase [Patescibacteria group bacterium]